VTFWCREASTLPRKGRKLAGRKSRFFDCIYFRRKGNAKRRDRGIKGGPVGAHQGRFDCGLTRGPGKGEVWGKEGEEGKARLS